VSDDRTDTTFVTALIFDVAPDAFAHIASLARDSSRRIARSIPGLIETAVLGNEEKTHLLILSRWQTKDAWVRSSWSADVGNVLADLVVSAAKFDVRTFVPISDIEGMAR
jgi:hypothetical protein